ncbi:SoxR reducing system RseC family protein [Aliivibrio kagoshimensis]|uniref:SoxR reducing system RseC family protein n=1 Tax=Aliivibrio kagoshimensis TaxID=2910230 RepID=UPI003D096F64
MMSALATVIDIENDRVTVGCKQQTSCGNCASKQSCGTGIVSGVIPGKEHQWTFTTQQSLTIGQLVEIGLPEKNLLQSAIIVYIIPLLFLLLGALFAQTILEPILRLGEPFVIAVAIVFTGVGFKLAKCIATRNEAGTEGELRLLRVLGAPLSDNMTTNAASEDS